MVTYLRKGTLLAPPTSTARLCQVSRIHLVSLLILCSAGASEARGQAPRLTAAEIAARVTPTVVTITTPTGTGSGVVVGANGLVVTNLHVVRGDTSASVRLSNGDVYDDVQVVDVDARRDLLVIKIKAVDLKAATLANSDQISVGDHVVVIGSPRGLVNSVTDGLISAIRDSGEGYRLFQTSAAVSPGSSGGGMFDDQGRLVGIVVSKRTDAENVNFAVPVNYARGLLTTTSVATTLADLARRFPSEANVGETERDSTRQGGAQTTAGLQVALKNSGLEFEDVGESTWKVQFKGDNVPVVTVFVKAYGNFAMANGTVATNVALDHKQMTELLKFNFANDFVKASISDGDLIVLNEMELRTVDGRHLELVVNAVARAVDDLAENLKAWMADHSFPPVTGPARGRLDTIALPQRTWRFRYDSGQWKMEKAAGNEDAVWKHSSGDVYFRVIAERAAVSIDAVESFAIENMKKVDPGAQLVRRGWQIVNGKKLLVLEVNVTLNRVPLTYYGHYYTDESGTIQILAWTTRNLIDEHRSTVDGVLAGLEIR